jgi:hypothetical protein
MLKNPFLPLVGLLVMLIGTVAPAQEVALVHPSVMRVSPLNDTVMRNIVRTDQVYAERLDTLPQVIFWRRIMKMTPDSGLISLQSTRCVFACFAKADWERLGTEGQDRYRDSIRRTHCLDSTASLLFTTGKNDFYDAAAVIPQIDRAIPIFIRDSVDPFYAQAILLIESPGKMLRSNVGAMGSFQLMKGVAISMGLKVNKSVDERKDFDKSAWAAAKLIRTVCIPYTNSMLSKRGIAYNPDELWYKLLVLHVYHAGAGNVDKALTVIAPTEGGMGLIKRLWQTTAGSFGKSSQAYSQLAVAAFIELDIVLGRHPLKTVYENTAEIRPAPELQLIQNESLLPEKKE